MQLERLRAELLTTTGNALHGANDWKEGGWPWRGG